MWAVLASSAARTFFPASSAFRCWYCAAATAARIWTRSYWVAEAQPSRPVAMKFSQNSRLREIKQSYGEKKVRVGASWGDGGARRQSAAWQAPADHRRSEGLAGVSGLSEGQGPR